MIVNLTPHPINIHAADGSIRTIEPTLPAARCNEKLIPDGHIDGVPAVYTVFGATENLPDFEENDETYYIVSLLVKSANDDREDLVSPADMVRDEHGRVIGCRALAR